ncbi:hypothetical protein [Dolichospermum sp. LEGE 00246]|uniref:hypothetical protein n=1 Tax=Dolichospermum sp. LEGE 00246 TaxID=1828605 RepID=UPI00187EFD2E|nr:hypothetical protein [Dolichospermum sp. LEGE 00246]MBE9257363.1 hypothetical protein [Dolichospermum sp. LEGE 00246]
MNKYILLFLSLTSINLLPVRAIAQSTQSCVNYWTNPQTGKQECLTVTYKPSFEYLGGMSRINKKGKRVRVKFYIEKNIAVTNGMSKPARQVTTFSDGYRFEDEIVVDCNNQAIAYKSESVRINGVLQGKDENETLEFEPVTPGTDGAAARTYNYICNGVIPKN